MPIISRKETSLTRTILTGRGSGVFARDPDAILTLTLTKKRSPTEATLRDFPTPSPSRRIFLAKLIHKPDMEPKLRKPGQTKDLKD